MQLTFSYRTKLEEDSVEHGKLVSAMTKERLSLEEKIAELNKSLVEVRSCWVMVWLTYKFTVSNKMV